MSSSITGFPSRRLRCCNHQNHSCHYCCHHLFHHGQMCLNHLGFSAQAAWQKTQLCNFLLQGFLQVPLKDTDKCLSQQEMKYFTQETAEGWRAAWGGGRDQEGAGEVEVPISTLSSSIVNIHSLVMTKCCPLISLHLYKSRDPQTYLCLTCTRFEYKRTRRKNYTRLAFDRHFYYFDFSKHNLQVTIAIVILGQGMILFVL